MNDTKQPEALRLADCLDDGHCSLRNVLHPAAAELRRLSQVETEYRERILRLEAALARSNASAGHDKTLDELRISEQDVRRLRSAVHKLHAAKGRYHTQIAACDLYDLLGLKNERPTK